MGEDRKLGARENRGREGNERGERKERAGGRSSQKGRKVGEITQQHSIVFRSQKGKRGEAKEKLASAGKPIWKVQDVPLLSIWLHSEHIVLSLVISI